MGEVSDISDLQMTCTDALWDYDHLQPVDKIQAQWWGLPRGSRSRTSNPRRIAYLKQTP
jgi:hypothetical protein